MSELDADLISAAAKGEKFLHAEVFRKMAALDLDSGDIEAILGAMHEAEQVSYVKSAEIGGPAAPAISPRALQGLALATLLAGPAISGVQFLMKQQGKDRGWRDLSSSRPDLVGQDPTRARAVYDLLHSTSPNIAQNPVIAGDIMTQMLSMPQVDLGTAAKLTEMGRNSSRISEGGVGDALKSLPGQLVGVSYLTTGTALPKGNEEKISARHIAEDGTPCLIDWSTPAMKQAGITDAFMGSGSTMEQADKGFSMGQMQQQSPLLPLDNVVKELLQKEMELAQREEILAQQEMQVQEALMGLQQMSHGYGEQFGVDPATGMAMGEDEMLPQDDMGQQMDPAMGAPPANAAGFPPEMGAPEPPPGNGMEGEMSPEEEAAMMAQEGGQEMSPEEEAAMMAQEGGQQMSPEEEAAMMTQEGGQQMSPEEEAAMMAQEGGQEMSPEEEEAMMDQEGQMSPEEEEAMMDQEGEMSPEEEEAMMVQEGGSAPAPVPAPAAYPGMQQGFTMMVPLPSLQITVKTAEEDHIEKAVRAAEYVMHDQFILPNN